MASDQVETFSADAPATQEKKGGGCLKGCLIAAAVLILLAVIVGWWIASNAKSLIGGAVSAGVEQALAESGLPEEEQAEIMVEVRRITDAFSSGELTIEESAVVMEELAQSPVMSVFIVMAVERGYLDNSGLSDEEKAEGSLALQRFGRGYVDESIDQSAIGDLMQHVADSDGDGGWDLRDPEEVSDDDLRGLIASAKQWADDAGVPEEVEPIDPSDAIKEIVDNALGQP